MSTTISDTIENSESNGHIANIFNLLVNDLKTIRDTIISTVSNKKQKPDLRKGDIVRIVFEMVPYYEETIIAKIIDVENEKLILFKNINNNRVCDLFYDEIHDIMVLLPDKLKKDIEKRKEIPIDVIENYLNKFDGII